MHYDACAAGGVQIASAMHCSQQRCPAVPVRRVGTQLGTGHFGRCAVPESRWQLNLSETGGSLTPQLLGWVGAQGRPC